VGAGKGPNFTIVLSDCPNLVLMPGDTCHVDVRFTPMGTGSKLATLAVSSSSTNAVVVRATLSGTGH
jgi:hypothetical protein